MSSLPTPSTNATVQGTPLFFLTSTQNNPAILNIQITSQYPFVYYFFDMRGHFICAAQTPDASQIQGQVSSYTLTVDFSSFPTVVLPMQMTVNIVDGGSWQMLNTTKITVLGGDVFNVKTIYPVQTNTMIEMSVDGAHILVKPEQMWLTVLEHSDVHSRGLS